MIFSNAVFVLCAVENFSAESEEDMKNLLVTAIIAAMASASGAEIISADADGYSDGANISTAFAGMTLSSQGSYSELNGHIYAWGDGLASTGTNVFANNLSSFQRQWNVNLSNNLAFYP